MSTAVLAVDQGTTNTKAVAFDDEGRLLAGTSVAVGLTNPRPGWVEQDGDELWSSVQRAIDGCVQQAGRPAALALCTQRESVLAWDRATGRPVGPVLSWQDTRTAAWCERARDLPWARRVPGTTGLPFEPMFSAPKMRWLLDRHPGEDLLLGTVDSWLVWCLTAGRRHVAEAGNASRTLLLDLAMLDWDRELVDGFAIPAAALPTVLASDGDFGAVVGGPVDGVPIVAVLADSHAALRGHGATTPEQVKATYGTGSSVMRPWPSATGAGPRLATTLAWLTRDGTATYGLEGNIRYSGAALDWTARLLGRTGGAELGALADQVPDAGGVQLVPAFGGLGAPYWDSRAQGTLTGLDAGSTPAHVARAAFEAVAHQVADVVEATPGRPRVLLADGGASASDLLMQLQADLLGVDVATATLAELSALGTAGMAAGRLGLAWPVRRPGRTFHPRVDDDERGHRRAGWAAAVERARGRSTEPPPHHLSDRS